MDFLPSIDRVLQRVLQFPATPPDCKRCAKVCGLLLQQQCNGFRAVWPIELGPVKTLAKSVCPGLRPLATDFQQFWLPSDSGEILGTCQLMSLCQGVLRFRFEVRVKRDVIWFQEYCLIQDGRRPDHPGVARVPDTNWMDTKVVVEWLETCRNSHGERCESVFNLRPVYPAWLIDTRENCLVPGKDCTHAEFVALSYRWGKAKGFQAQGGSVKQLRKRGALVDPATRTQLAPLIQQAIELTPRIGQRYIWIDDLCIDHSQPAESTAQLQLMGAIYASAVLTIISLDGDAQQGVLGLEDASVSRSYRPKFVQFCGERFIHREQGEIDASDPYHGRAWTHQEHHMSRRRLSIQKGLLKWVCSCNDFAEHIDTHLYTLTSRDPYLTVLFYGVPSLRCLGLVIRDYNRRDLSYEEDALPGITGLLTLLSRVFPGGFLCGIPEICFEACLTWRRSADSGDLRRRHASKRPDSARLHPCHLPSWSWIGWHGSINLENDEDRPLVRSHHFEHGPQDEPVDRIRESFPITTWYATASSTAKPKRIINSNWSTIRANYKKRLKRLDEKWGAPVTFPPVADPLGVQQDYRTAPAYPDGCGKAVYSLPYMPPTATQESYHWPLPLINLTEDTPTAMPEQDPFICCDTRRARVRAFLSSPEPDFLQREPEVHLHDEPGHVIGKLFLHSRAQASRFKLLRHLWEDAAKIELVAICRQRYYHRTSPTSAGMRAGVHPIATSEVYAVLWVGWKDGIACRLASGEVDKSSWEALDLEDVFLVLG